MKRYVLLAIVLLFAWRAAAQNCPKVTYTTSSATTKSLVATVNCLNAAAAASNAAGASALKKAGKGVQVESFQIVGPQHNHAYSSVVLAILSVPSGSSTKTAVVTPDAREATVAAEAGGTCSVKINPDKTVDSQCFQAGGTVFVVYR
jgi:hypothetical protein